MKKIISLLFAAALIFSLAACGGSESGAETETNSTPAAPVVSTYVNDETLNADDNVSFIFSQTEDGKEVYMLNIKAPGVLNNLAANDEYTLHNDKLTLRNMGKGSWSNYVAYFTFMGYGEIQLKVYDAGEIDFTSGEYVIIAQDGDFLLTKKGDNYDVWSKTDKELIKVMVDGYNGYRITTEEGFINYYNTIKSHFTFAKTTVSTITKDGLSYTVPSLGKAVTWGANKADSVVGWTFSNDLLYKQLEDMGLALTTAQNLYGSNEFYNAHYVVADDKTFALTIKPLVAGEPTFDSCDAATEFSVGEVKFRKDARNTLYGKDALGFIFKAKNGKEYALGIYPTGSFEGFSDKAMNYFNLVVSASK